MITDIAEKYLEAHRHSWAESTMRTERYRLTGILTLPSSASPEELWRSMQAAGWKPYTIKTAFVRLSAMERWSRKDLGYDKFLREMRNRFKHSYERKDVRVTYEEAVSRIDQISCSKTKAMALDMLKTGVRLSEAYAIKDGSVRGKGNKLRRVFGEVKAEVPRSTLWARLKAVGLKPHDLRKLCATRLAERGATAADLCKVFGWSSIATAYRYLQPKDDSKIQEMMNADI